MTAAQSSSSPAVPARPVGALILFLVLFGIVIAVLAFPIDGSGDCSGPLFAKSYERTDAVCGRFFEARMVWFQLLAIPTIVAGCATVSRWPKYRRAADGSYVID